MKEWQIAKQELAIESQQASAEYRTTGRLASEESIRDCTQLYNPKYQVTLQNIAKGTTDPRIEFISQVLPQILIKFLLKNLHQALTSKSQPNISISTKL